MSLTDTVCAKLIFLIVYFNGFNQCFRLPSLQKFRFEHHLKGGNNCGYNSCPALLHADNVPGYNATIQGDILNVHLISHSHDDTGWLKTVDQYYRGSNKARFGAENQNQRVGVKYILDTVVKELLFDSSRRYVVHAITSQ